MSVSANAAADKRALAMAEAGNAALTGGGTIPREKAAPVGAVGQQESMAPGTPVGSTAEPEAPRGAGTARRKKAVPPESAARQEAVAPEAPTADVATTRQAAAPPLPAAAEREPALADKSGGAREMEQVLKAWPDIMSALRRAKPSLYPAFLNAAPLRAEGGVLTVGFPEGDELSMGMAERQDNKDVFAGLLGKFLDSCPQARYEYYLGEPPLPVDQPEPVNDISRRFGGQEVEPPDDYEEEMRHLFDDME